MNGRDSASGDENSEEHSLHTLQGETGPPEPRAQRSSRACSQVLNALAGLER